MKLQIKKLVPEAVIPQYAKMGDACFDLTAVSKVVKDKYIEYGTGLAVAIPEGHVGLVFPRSSVTNMDLILKNSVGVIDSSYRGEIKFRFNTIQQDMWKLVSDDEYLSFHTRKTADIYEVGDRVGQMLILPIPYVTFEEVEELSETERGRLGFGSTGL